MKTLTEQLVQYARYHRDRRNIATHLVGVPMIVLAVTILLDRPAWSLGSLMLSPAVLAALAASLYYLRLHRGLGLLMALLLACSLAVAHQLSVLATPVWLGWGVGLFVLGWIIQFVGHAWEGRKPAFVDDIMGLLIGPLFVVVELGFLLGLGKGLQASIVDQAGPTHGAAAALGPRPAAADAAGATEARTCPSAAQGGAIRPS